MLTYYPAVAASGNLAEALTRSFGRMGSSLSAYSPEPSAPPPSTDSPQPPHMPEADWARVRVGDRLCQMVIGLFIFPIGSFCLTFFDKENENNDALTSPLGMMLTEDLATAAHIIRRFLEDRAGLKRLAKESGVRFAPDPYSRPAPDSVQRMLRDILVNLAESDEQKAEELLRHILEELAESDPKTTKNLLRHVLQKLAKSDQQKAKDLRRRIEELKDRDRREE